MHQHTKNRSLLEFLAASPSPELSNGQCKRFSGYLHHGQADDETLFEMAQQTLNECFSLVLTTCLFDEGLLLLKNRLELQDIYYQKSNVSKAYIHRADLTEQELSTMEQMNQADSKLFTWAKTACQKLVKNELTSTQIKHFRTANQQWAELISN